MKMYWTGLVAAVLLSGSTIAPESTKGGDGGGEGHGVTTAGHDLDLSAKGPEGGCGDRSSEGGFVALAAEDGGGSGCGP